MKKTTFWVVVILMVFGVGMYVKSTMSFDKKGANNLRPEYIKQDTPKEKKEAKWISSTFKGLIPETGEEIALLFESNGKEIEIWDASISVWEYEDWSWNEGKLKGNQYLIQYDAEKQYMLNCKRHHTKKEYKQASTYNNNSLCSYCGGDGIVTCTMCAGTGKNNIGADCGCVTLYINQLRLGHKPTRTPMHWSCEYCN